MKVWIGYGVGSPLVKAMQRARREIVVVSPWITKDYGNILVDARKRGVNVRVITQEKENPGLEVFRVRKMRKWGIVLSLLLLIMAIISIYYHIPPGAIFLFLFPLPLIFSWKKTLPDWVKVLDHLHAKIYIVDDRVFLSSANLTRSGMNQNLEFLLELDLHEAKDVLSQVKSLV